MGKNRKYEYSSAYKPLVKQNTECLLLTKPVFYGYFLYPNSAKLNPLDIYKKIRICSNNCIIFFSYLHERIRYILLLYINTLLVL